MRGRITIALFAFLFATPVVLGGNTFFAGLQRRLQIQHANKASGQGNDALAATLYKSLRDRTPDVPKREDLKLRQGILPYHFIFLDTQATVNDVTVSINIACDTKNSLQALLVSNSRAIQNRMVIPDRTILIAGLKQDQIGAEFVFLINAEIMSP